MSHDCIIVCTVKLSFWIHTINTVVCRQKKTNTRIKIYTYAIKEIRIRYKIINKGYWIKRLSLYTLNMVKQ